MLEGACIAYQAAIQAYEDDTAAGPLVAKRILDPATNKLVVSNVKPHPAVAQGNAAWMLLKAFLLGIWLESVSRTRLTIEKTH